MLEKENMPTTDHAETPIQPTKLNFEHILIGSSSPSGLSPQGLRGPAPLGTDEYEKTLGNEEVERAHTRRSRAGSLYSGMTAGGGNAGNGGRGLRAAGGERERISRRHSTTSSSASPSYVRSTVPESILHQVEENLARGRRLAEEACTRYAASNAGVQHAPAATNLMGAAGGAPSGNLERNLRLNQLRQSVSDQLKVNLGSRLGQGVMGGVTGAGVQENGDSGEGRNGSVTERGGTPKQRRQPFPPPPADDTGVTYEEREGAEEGQAQYPGSGRKDPRSGSTTSVGVLDASSLEAQQEVLSRIHSGPFRNSVSAWLDELVEVSAPPMNMMPPPPSPSATWAPAGAAAAAATEGGPPPHAPLGGGGGGVTAVNSPRVPPVVLPNAEEQPEEPPPPHNHTNEERFRPDPLSTESSPHLGSHRKARYKEWMDDIVEAAMKSAKVAEAKVMSDILSNFGHHGGTPTGDANTVHPRRLDAELEAAKSADFESRLDLQDREVPNQVESEDLAGFEERRGSAVAGGNRSNLHRSSTLPTDSYMPPPPPRSPLVEPLSATDHFLDSLKDEKSSSGSSLKERPHTTAAVPSWGGGADLCEACGGSGRGSLLPSASTLEALNAGRGEVKAGGDPKTDQAIADKESSEDKEASLESRLATLEEEYAVQQMLLRTAVGRQARLERELEEARSASAAKSREISLLRVQNTEYQSEARRTQQLCQEMASGRRSARAALAEMASHNARLVAAFAEKKQDVRRLSGELERAQEKLNQVTRAGDGGGEAEAKESENQERPKEEGTAAEDSANAHVDGNSGHDAKGNRKDISHSQDLDTPTKARRSEKEAIEWEAERARLVSEIEVWKKRASEREREQEERMMAAGGGGDGRIGGDSGAAGAGGVGGASSPQHHQQHHQQQQQQASHHSTSASSPSGERLARSQTMPSCSAREMPREADHQREPGMMGHSKSMDSTEDANSPAKYASNSTKVGGASEKSSGLGAASPSSVLRMREENEKLSHENAKLKEAQRASTSRQRAEELKAKGNNLFHVGRHKEAGEAYTQGLQLSLEADPKLAAVMHSNRSACYQATRQYLDALVDASAALRLDPGYLRAHQRRADALLSLGDSQAALKDLETLHAMGNTEIATKLHETRIKARRPPPMDHYAVMGVSNNCTSGDIKQAYRQLALKHHPDKANDSMRETAEIIFKYVQQAYAILSDAIQRKKYDASLHSARFRYQRHSFNSGWHSGFHH